MSNLADITPNSGVINIPYINENYHNSPNSNMSASIDKIAQALSKAQSELDSAKKDNSGYGYNYSDLATVIANAKPVLSKFGLAITQLVGKTDSSVSVTTILTHESGQHFKSDATLPVIDMKGCNAAQGAGASLSYLRRYAYQAIIGMASEDNDASSEGYKSKASVSASSKSSETSTPEAKKTTTFKRVATATTTASSKVEATGANDDL